MTGSLYLGSSKVCPVIVKGDDKEGLPREVTQSGVYGYPTAYYNFALPNTATDLGDYALYYAFANDTKVRNADLSSLTSASGTSCLERAFYYANKLLTLDLSNLTTASTLSRMCQGCAALATIDLSSLTTTTTLENAFYGCNLVTANLSNLTACPSLTYCFYNNENLETLNLSKLKGTSDSPVTISYMCSSCNKLSTLDVSKLEYVNIATSAFYHCRSLQELDLSSVKSIAGVAQSLAKDCTNLKTIRLSSLTNVSVNKQFGEAFNLCSALENVYFDNLVQIGASSTDSNNNSHFYLAFNNSGVYNKIDLTFPKLEKIYCNGSNSSALGTFYNCVMFRKLYFPKLDTISYYSGTASSYQHACKYVFQNCSNLTEIHFAAANQASIEASPGWSTRWGRGVNNVTVYFDL